MDLWWLIAYLALKLGWFLVDVHAWACQRWCRKHLNSKYKPDPEICFQGSAEPDLEVYERKIDLAEEIGIWISRRV